ncbi:MAG: HAMP domain-containing protein [Nonomuraea sp.]|nr:HAMP domain-containing protein [Nonomuraea sp.]
MRTANTLLEPEPGVAETAGAVSGPPVKPSRRRKMAVTWRVRPRLIALILIPTLATVLLGALRVSTAIETAGDYQRLSQVAQLSQRIGTLTHAAQLERDMAAIYFANPRRLERHKAWEGQQVIVNDAVANVRTALQGLDPDQKFQIQDAAVQVNRWLSAFNGLRSLKKVSPRAVIRTYSRMIEDIGRVNTVLTNEITDDNLFSQAQALVGLSGAKEELSRQRAIAAAGLVTGTMDYDDLTDFVGSLSRQQKDLETFQSEALPNDLQFYLKTVAGPDVYKVDATRNEIQTRLRENRTLRNLDDKPGTDDAQAWFSSATKTVDLYREVEKRLEIGVVTGAQELQNAEQKTAYTVAILVVALLAVVLLITLLVARSIVRPLRRLRTEALEIAGRRLPETVRIARESPDGSARDVQPIGVSSGDEFGEVARAFDEVHREAVRLAGEEARLRSNVNAMFVNLSRRSQTLVERQITLIDGLEQGEQDETRLSSLFKLDHLATRMRRNSENLLVLAGQDPPRRWSQPVKLVDVARASLSEVENYERVVLQVPDGVAIAGQAVNDVIHLLAELVENALSFSPRETRVTVSGSRIDGGGVMLSISDSGIGMTAEEFAQANARLTELATVDVSVSRRMGLFVVSRLAHRHGIRVQLRPHGSGGLTAMVMVPEALLGAQAPTFAGTAPQPQAAPSMPSLDDGFTGPWQGVPYEPGAGHPSFPSVPAMPSIDQQFPSFATDPGRNGSAHPSFPSDPAQMNGSWSQAPHWPSEPQWPSEPRAAGGFDAGSGGFDGVSTGFDAGSGGRYDTGSGGYDTGDVWQASRGRPWQEENPLPRRGLPPEEPPAPRYDFPETESAATGPIPKVNQGDDYLPIFAAVESAWFDHGENGASWGSPKADAGWSAAEAVIEPVRDGATSSGLPKRVPRANLVPGSADTVSAPKGVAPMPSVSPDRVRSRLSSFQQGFRAARDDLSEGRAQPRTVDNREEGA